MKVEKTYVTKILITPGSVHQTRDNYPLEKEKTFMCFECMSPLFYVGERFAVIDEELEYNIVGYKRDKMYLVLRVVGLDLYCAECGQWNKDYDSWVYKEPICYLDDMDSEEKENVMFALDTYNHTGEVRGSYEGDEIKILRGKIKEYEEKQKNEKTDEKTD